MNPRQCPACGSVSSVPRYGFHVEHERRCLDCDHCWCPEEAVRKVRDVEAERLEFNTHRE